MRSIIWWDRCAIDGNEWRLNLYDDALVLLHGKEKFTIPVSDLVDFDWDGETVWLRLAGGKEFTIETHQGQLIIDTIRRIRMPTPHTNESESNSTI